MLTILRYFYYLSCHQSSPSLCSEHCSRFTHTISAVLTKVSNFVGGLDLGDPKPRSQAIFLSRASLTFTDHKFHYMAAISSPGTSAISSRVKRPKVCVSGSESHPFSYIESESGEMDSNHFFAPHLYWNCSFLSVQKLLSSSSQYQT